jgi:hypothetical protein
MLGIKYNAGEVESFFNLKEGSDAEVQPSI